LRRRLVNFKINIVLNVPGKAGIVRKRVGGGCSERYSERFGVSSLFKMQATAFALGSSRDRSLVLHGQIAVVIVGSKRTGRLIA